MEFGDRVTVGREPQGAACDLFDSLAARRIGL